MAKKPAGHKKTCKCPFCKRAKKSGAKKSGAKKGAKKGGAKRKTTGSFAVGHAEGMRDVHAGKPLRAVGKRKDSYSDGYRHGVRSARGAKKHAK